MPKVPEYGPRQVRTMRLPGARLTNVPSPEAYGAGFFAGAARIAGNAAGDMLDQQRLYQDQVVLVNANRQLSEWEDTRLYNPDTGALTVKGRDSFGLPEQVDAEFAKKANDISSALTNDRQRMAFARSSQQRREAISLSLHRHVFSEIQEYDEAETKAFIASSVSNAIANANDPRRIGDELNRAVAAVRDNAKRQGIGSELIQERVQGVQTAIHTGVINRLLATNQDRAAQIYFSETKGQISGEQLARIEAALEEGSLRGEAQRRADAIGDEAGSLELALRQVRGIDDPKLRDAVQERVEHRFIQKEKVEREAHENMMVQAGNIIDAKGLQGVPPGLWVELDVREKTALEQYAKRNAKGEGDQTDLPTYYGLMQQSSTAPDKFAALNLLLFMHKLGKTEFKQLVELQNSIRNGDRKKADTMLDGFRTNNEIVLDTLHMAGIPTSGKESNQKEIGLFNRAVDEEVERQQRAGGKKLTNTEVRNIADGIVNKAVATPNSWFWRLLGSPASSKRLIDVTVNDIPSQDRQQIEAAIKARGLNVTDEAMVQVFVTQQLRTPPVERSQPGAGGAARPGVGTSGVAATDVPAVYRKEIESRLRSRGLPATDENVLAAYNAFTARHGPTYQATDRALSELTRAVDAVHDGIMASRRRLQAEEEQRREAIRRAREGRR